MTKLKKGEVKITVIASGFADGGAPNTRRNAFDRPISPASALDDEQPRGKIYNTLQSLTRDVKKPISEKYEPKVETRQVDIKPVEEKIEPTAATNDDNDDWGVRLQKEEVKKKKTLDLRPPMGLRGAATIPVFSFFSNVIMSEL